MCDGVSMWKMMGLLLCFGSIGIVWVESEYYCYVDVYEYGFSEMNIVIEEEMFFLEFMVFVYDIIGFEYMFEFFRDLVVLDEVWEILNDLIVLFGILKVVECEIVESEIEVLFDMVEEEFYDYDYYYGYDGDNEDYVEKEYD